MPGHRKDGPLGPFVDGYRDSLVQAGYTSLTIRFMLRHLGCLGRWMDAAGVGLGELTVADIEVFLDDWRAAGGRRIPTIGGLRALLSYLRQVGVMAEQEPVLLSPVESLISEYRHWMLVERGLAAMTVLRYETLARRFLTGRVSVDDSLGVTGIDGAVLSRFLLGECDRVCLGSAKGRVAELRALMRYLHLRGLTERSLADAIPGVAGWRDTAIPPTMPQADIERLIASCDLSTIDGVRDRAMLLLLARLGVRSIEIARLELDDLDWRAGDLLLRGKARRDDRLPLPGDVGDALVDYLRVRGRHESRNVFLTLRAPIRPIRADLVGDVVQRHCRWAGVPHVGPHRLRHTLATRMLAQGAQLADISQVLRHSDLATTAVYAKVDLGRLGEVARPLAGSSAMTVLAEHLGDYLALRRTLGHKLAEAQRLLPRFVTYLEERDIEFVTIEVALAWSLERELPANSTVPAHRMMLVRGFARYMSGVDPRTEVPPAGTIRHRNRWRQPFIYSDTDVLALIQAAGSLKQPLRAATYQTLIGLLASTGLRVGEALRLDHSDLDLVEGVLQIRETKFGKSRLVPLHASTIDALERYVRTRQHLLPGPSTDALFVSLHGTRVIYECVWPTHRNLCQQAGVGAGSSVVPRIHDHRHSFAVNTLRDWYSRGVDVQSQIGLLSTYLGHREPRYTYHYLSAAPDLLAHAARLLDQGPRS